MDNASYGLSALDGKKLAYNETEKIEVSHCGWEFFFKRSGDLFGDLSIRFRSPMATNLARVVVLTKWKHDHFFTCIKIFWKCISLQPQKYRNMNETTLQNVQRSREICVTKGNIGRVPYVVTLTTIVLVEISRSSGTMATVENGHILSIQMSLHYLFVQAVTVMTS